MLARILARVLAAASFVTAVAAPLAAQTTVLNASTTTAAPNPAERGSDPVVVIRLETLNHDRTMPSVVTVADSAGRLVATYRLPKDSTEHPMGVFVYNDDLVIVGETTRGVLEMVFENQAQHGPGSTITGRWSRGTEEGLLQGRVKR
jgi:hypothetical protein